MTKSTETLEQRAARVTEEMQQVQQEQQHRAREHAERLAASQAAFDAEVVERFARDELDADVLQARRALNQAIAESPLGQALSEYYTAATRRHERWQQYLSALARTGRDIVGAQTPTIDPINLPELMDRAAQADADDWRSADRADFESRRDATPKEN